MSFQKFLRTGFDGKINGREIQFSAAGGDSIREARVAIVRFAGRSLHRLEFSQDNFNGAARRDRFLFGGRRGGFCLM